MNADGAAADTIDNDRCLKCHQKIARESAYTTGRGYRKRHAEHTAAGVRCTDCHNRVAHKDAESHAPIVAGAPAFRYADRLKMEKGCWRCHSADPRLRDDDRMDELMLAELPPTACASCHVSPPAPASGPLNHIGWPGGDHGKMRGQDFTDCLPCHAAAGSTRGPVSDCTGCHNGMTMPHKTDANSKFYESEPQVPLWSREHARYRRREESCRMCHPSGGASDSCTACHHKDYLSGGAGKNWAQKHKIKANERNAGCQTCHMLEFCSYCHERGEKPRPGLFMYRMRRKDVTKPRPRAPDERQKRPELPGARRTKLELKSVDLRLMGHPY